MYFFNGEHKEADESLENLENKKSKGEKQIKSSQDLGKGSKAIKASIYQSMVIYFILSNYSSKIHLRFSMTSFYILFFTFETNTIKQKVWYIENHI